jgi:transposase
MIAQLKYGNGTPFYRLEQPERHLGIPLPAAIQWEIVEEAAEVIKLLATYALDGIMPYGA